MLLTSVSWSAFVLQVGACQRDTKPTAQSCFVDLSNAESRLNTSSATDEAEALW